jgi:hypothetical protein
MYPDETTLAEVGRIAIAAGRLDAALGALWWQLAPDQVAELEARTAPAGRVRERIETLATERLVGEHRTSLLGFVAEVRAAQKQRNEVLHSNWLLRGLDAMRPVSEFLRLEETERQAYLEEWEREARASEDWQRQPSDATTFAEPHRVEELRQIERRLREAEQVAVRWQFAIASMRNVGKPRGWQGPPGSKGVDSTSFEQQVQSGQDEPTPMHPSAGRALT